MDTVENKTRKAYLPMVLMNDGDLDYINQSELTGQFRDVAVYFMMAECLLDLGKRSLNACYSENTNIDTLLKLLADKGYTDMINIINNRSK
jgi:hypothetical protein